MRALLKKIYSDSFQHEKRNIVNLVLYRIVILIVWVVYYFKFRKELGLTKKFINEIRIDVQEKNKFAFVFANGPSLSQIDLLKIKKYCDEEGGDLIAINSFLSKSADVVKPRFAVFADNVHFAGGESQYSEDVDTCRSLGIQYFAPVKYLVKGDVLMHGYCSICNLDSNSTSDILKPAGYYGVTAFFAISLAKMIGYKAIYICGFDNSYFKDFSVSRDGVMSIHHKHYYDKSSSNTKISPSYKNTSQFFFDVYRHFLYLEKICDDAHQIKNVALDSYLSSIPRCNDLDIYKNVSI